MDIKSIFDAYNDRVFSFVLRNVRNSEIAKDITQEIFLKICINKCKVKQAEDMGNYIFLIAKNTMIDYYRKAAHELEYRRTLKERVLDPIDAQMHHDHYKVVLREALDRLPPRQKRIFVMHKQEGLSLHDIAEILQISAFTAKNHLAQARKSLRKMIKPELIYSACSLYLIC